MASSVEKGGMERLLGTIARIAEFDDLQSFRTGISGEVRRLVACDLASYNEIRPDTGEAIALLDPVHALADEAVEAFAEFAHQNPLVAYERRTRNGQAVRLSDFVSRRELHRLELYEFVYRQLETEYQVAIALPAPGGSIIGLALNRTRRDFSAGDRELLDLLRPHAAAAHRRLSERAQILRALAEHEHDGKAGVILLDGGSLAFATEGALELLPELASGQLPSALRRWAGDRFARRSDLPLHSAFGRLTARFAERQGPEREDAIEIRLGGGRADGMADSFDLTERQAEILGLVALGMSNQQIANSISLSARTVEKHLERTFRRLGVSNRTEAAAYVKSRH
jgi:DNA-binding CsgD family transcriptional regulator